MIIEAENGPRNMGTWTIVVHISVQTPPMWAKKQTNRKRHEKYRKVSKSIKHIQTFSKMFITFYHMLCRLWTNTMWLGLPMHLPRTQLPEFHPPESAMAAMPWCPDALMGMGIDGPNLSKNQQRSPNWCGALVGIGLEFFMISRRSATGLQPQLNLEMHADSADSAARRSQTCLSLRGHSGCNSVSVESSKDSKVQR